MKKAVIYINNCPVHLMEQMKFKAEQFCNTFDYQEVENLTDASLFITLIPVNDEIVAIFDNVKERQTMHHVFSLY